MSNKKKKWFVEDLSYDDGLETVYYDKNKSEKQQVQQGLEELTKNWGKKKSSGINVSQIGKGLWDITTAPVKWGANLGKSTLDTTKNAWNSYIDYMATGDPVGDTKKTIKNVGNEIERAKSLGQAFKYGNLETKKEIALTGKEGETIFDRYILPVMETGNIAAKRIISGNVDIGKKLYNDTAMATQEILHGVGIYDDEKYQEQKQKRIEYMKEDTTERFWKFIGWDDDVKNYVKRNSFVTEENLAGQVVSNLTYMLEIAALGETPVGWEVPSFLSSAGAIEQNEYRKGANDLQALASGILGGTIEVFTEKMFGGVLKPKGTGKWASVEALENYLTEKISNNTLKFLAQYGINVLNEDMEEWVGGYANALAQKLIYMNDEEMQDLYTKEDAMNDFLITTLTTMLSGGGNLATKGTQQVKEDIRTGRSQITGYTQNEQKIIDAEVENRLEEAKKNGEKVKTKQVIEEVQEDLTNGNISIESLQKAVGGEQYQTLKQNNEKVKDVQTQLEEVNKKLSDNYSTKVSKMNPEYQNLINQQKDLSNQLAELKATSKKLSVPAYQELVNTLSNDAIAQQSIYENELGGIKYEYNKTGKESENANFTYETAEKHLNNQTLTRKFVDAVSKISETNKKGTKIGFTNTQEIKEKGLIGTINYEVKKGDTIQSVAQEYGMTLQEFKELNPNIKTLEEGQKVKLNGFTEGLYDRDNNILYINVDSNRALEEIVGHELTHVLEGTKDYDNLRSLLYKQAKKKGIFDSEKERLEEFYEAKDIDNELTAELASKLFDDADFINEVATQRTTYQKVMDFLDDMIKTFKGTKEEKQLIKAQREFRKAFENMSKETGEGKQFSNSAREFEIKPGEDTIDFTKRFMDEYDMPSLSQWEIGQLAEAYEEQTGYDGDFRQELKDYIDNYGMDSLADIEEKYGIVYNNGKTLDVSKEDYKVLERDYNNQKNLYKANSDYYYLRTANDIYVSRIGENEKIQPIMRIKAGTNVELVNALQKGDLDYDTIRKDIASITSRQWTRQELLRGYSSNTKERGTTSRNDSLFNSKQKSNIEGNNESSNGNIQHSLTKDSQNRTLTESQIEFYKDAKTLDENGNLKVYYHGSPNTFTTFDITKAKPGLYGRGFYFANEKTTSDLYEKGGKTYEVYINSTNPLQTNTKNITKEQLVNFLDAVAQNEDYSIENYGTYDTQQIANDMYDKSDFQMLQDVSATAIGDMVEAVKLFNEVNGTNYDGIEAADQFIAFEPNQIKETTNKNPTSNPDIRYSISKQGKLQEDGKDVTLETSDAGTHGNLMAIHNLNETKFNGILDLGGFPYPSIAITKPGTIKHEGYGEISVLFNKDTISPETNSKNKVYSRDAYTPRFPTVEYKINSNAVKNIRDVIGDYDYRNTQPGDSYISDARNILDNLEDSVNRKGLEKTLDEIKDSDAMKYVYLKNINPNFKAETKNEQFSNLYSNETLQRFIDNYDGKYELNDIPSNEIDNYTKQMVDAFRQQLEEKYDNSKIIEMQINNLENSFASKDNFLRAAYKMQKYGTEHQVLDSVATSEKINNTINQNEFNKWIDNQFRDIVEKKGLRNNKEYYTPSGTPRSFEQLHDEYTLNNVVKIMDALNDTGEEGGFFYGISEIAGNASQRFNSIEDIKASENLLTTIGDEEYTQMLDNISDRLSTIEEAIMERGHNNSDNYFIARDNLSSAIGELARDYGSGKKINTAKMIKHLNEYGFNATTEETQQMLDMFKEMRELPTTYFEAKPQRAVGLDEVQQVVLPSNADAELKQKLQDMNIPFTEYNPEVEGDRQRVINQFDELKWSMSKNNDIAPLKRGLTYNANVQENIIPTYDETQIAPLPKRTMNPFEISQLTPEDANTTPILPTRNYKPGNEKSSFYENVTEKTKMLPEDARELLKTQENIEYYDKVTNEQSMNDALARLNENGAAETLRWFKEDSTNATATDVAEGWILMKQYADAGDYSSMVEVAKKMRDIGTKAGQTVQAFNIMSRLTPEGMVKYAQSELSEAYDQMVKNKTKKWIDENQSKFELTPNEVEFIMNTMENLQNIEGEYEKKVELAKIQKILTDKLPPEKGRGIKAWMRLSMLFNPKTQVRNVVGNALIMPINSFGDLFSSAADYGISKITGVRTTGRTNIKALAKGSVEGFKQATNDFKLGINTKDMEGNRFEMGEGKSFREKTIIGKSLNRTEAMLNYVMDAGDRVFSQAAYENSIENQKRLNHTDIVTPEMVDIALQESLSRTWNDNNNYTRFVLNVRKGLNALNIRGYGLGDVLIPFAKTPANLTKAIVDYSPAGLINTLVQGKNLYNNIKTDTWTAQQQHQFVQTLGKATAGSMLYVLAYGLAKAGIASGKSDDDKDTRDFLKNTLGISSYSIKIGDKSYTYDWAQPLAAPLAIMTNIENGEKAQGLLEAIISSLDNGSSVLMEQSFLQSLNDVLNGNGKFTENLMDEILDLPTRAVPTFVKQINDMVDDTQRQTFVKDKPFETAINKFKAKIPGLSQDLAPVVDTMGREVQKYGGKNNLFNVFLNPANVNTENISEEAKEIYDVYKQTGDKTILPRVAPYYIDSKGERRILTTNERAEFQKEAGQLIEDGMQDFMNSSEYALLNDEDKAAAIKNLIDYSYNKAKEEVLDMPMANTYNKVNKYISNGGNVGDYYLNKKEIDAAYKWLEDGNEESKVALSKSVTGDVFSYNKIRNDITTIKNNTTNDKQEVLTYVQDLDLDTIQKAILFKSYYKSYKQYDREIVEYLNSRSDITQDEEFALLEKLGYKVNKSKGTVSW